MRSRTLRGRKPRLSSEMIVSVACQMLSEGSLEEFSLVKLARRINAGVMSLYTYFPNRDALLTAVADDIFDRFEPPEITASMRWQTIVNRWLWATQKLLDEHPAVLKVLFWDGRHSASFIRSWWLPLAQLLRERGMDNARISFAMNWFPTSALGMMAAQMNSAERRHSLSFTQMDLLDRDQQRLVMDLWLHLGDVERDVALEFGFNNLIHGLEQLIAGKPVTGRVVE